MSRSDRRRYAQSSYTPVSADAGAWFASVESAGSVFEPGAKQAYDTFFLNETASGNLAVFDNGMLLLFVGFTGLAGCFVPVKSRSNTLPTNVGFTEGLKYYDGLQGNNAAYINTNLDTPAGMRDAHCVGTRGDQGSGSPSSAGHMSSRGAAVNNTIEILNTGAVTVAVTLRSASTLVDSSVPFTGGQCFINRSVAASHDFYTTSSVTNVVQATTGIVTGQNMLIFSLNTSFLSARKAQLAYFGDNLPNPLSFRSSIEILMSGLGVP